MHFSYLAPLATCKGKQKLYPRVSDEPNWKTKLKVRETGDPNTTFAIDRADRWEYDLSADNRTDTERNSRARKYMFHIYTFEVGIIFPW